MKNRHYEVILMAFFFLAPPYLQAGEITSTLSFSGCNNSTLSVTTNTNWVSDTIDIRAFSEAYYNMYMYVNSALDSTRIGRNALYIGDGFITTSSRYFNAPEGEVSVTGIYIEGNCYGVLVQRPLEFNAGFGGVRESTAAVGGNNYLVQQFGYVDAGGSGTFTPQSDYGVFTSINGNGSAAITSTDFGSFPGPGSDVFRANTTSWAFGDGTYSFSSESPVEQLNVDWAFGWGDSTIIVDDDTLQINDYFNAN